MEVEPDVPNCTLVLYTLVPANRVNECLRQNLLTRGDGKHHIPLRQTPDEAKGRAK